jgi:hypothetical protein
VILPGSHRTRYPFLAVEFGAQASEARAELQYAAPALERDANRARSSSVYARRRQELAARTLSSI